jgi:replicative DNA helicase
MICIDYMQLLKLSPSTRTRHEELKQICLMLNECAIATGLPLVLAAQFNRTVTTEADLSPVQIGEAGDIERIASLIIGIFNRAFNAMCRTGNMSREGYSVPKESTLYVEVLKGRKIGNGHWCIMNINGNSGVISNLTKSSMLKGFENMHRKDAETTRIQPARKPYDGTLIDLIEV